MGMCSSHLRNFMQSMGEDARGHPGAKREGGLVALQSILVIKKSTRLSRISLRVSTIPHKVAREEMIDTCNNTRDICSSLSQHLFVHYPVDSDSIISIPYILSNITILKEEKSLTYGLIQKWE